MVIFLASNLITVPYFVGYENWAHLQLVRNNLEIEVQSPSNKLTIPFGGDWFYESIRSHSATTDNYAVVGKYRAVALDTGERLSENVWTVLSNIHTQFSINGKNIDYNFDQNSNSYVNTLMYMIGAPLTGGLLASVTPALVTDGFPRVGTNVALNDEAFGFDLNLSNGKDFINTGIKNDVVNGLDGNDTINTWAGEDLLDGGDGDDILTGSADRDTYIISKGNDVINDDGNRDYLSKFEGVGAETKQKSGIYKLTDDATAQLVGGSLVITHADGTLTLQNWNNGDYGIMQCAANDNNSHANVCFLVA